MLLQSGSSVSEWMLKLPKPSKLNRRRMGKVKRGNDVDTSGRIGRADAIKKRCCLLLLHATEFDCFVFCRDMILGSKRRKTKLEEVQRGDDSSWSGFDNTE